jgi:hypothetical protein
MVANLHIRTKEDVFLFKKKTWTELLPKIHVGMAEDAGPD